MKERLAKTDTITKTKSAKEQQKSEMSRKETSAKIQQQDVLTSAVLHY